MRNLEIQLNVELLERSPSGTTLSPQGEQLLTLVRQVLVNAEAVNDLAKQLASESNSGIEVAASLTVSEFLIPDWMRELTSESPELRFSLQVVNSSQVVANVLNHSVDVGFIEGVFSETRELESQVVGGDRLVVVVGADHPWAAEPRATSAAALAATPLLTREIGSGTRDVLDLRLAPWGGVNSQVVLGSTGALLGAARRGGPAVLSELAVAKDLALGSLIEIPVPEIDLRREFRAIWMRGRAPSAIVERLLSIARSSHSSQATPPGYPVP